MKADNLYELDALIKLDKDFLEYLRKEDNALATTLQTARKEPEKTSGESELIIQLSPYCEKFITKLFRIEKEINKLFKAHQDFSHFYECKRNFVQRYALKKYSITNQNDIEGLEKLFNILGKNFSEAQYVAKVTEWLQNKEQHSEILRIAAQYATWAHKHKKNSILFATPSKLDFDNLVETQNINCAEINIKKSPHTVHREGFGLTDEGGSREEALNEAHYCIYCHSRNKDSCSTGFKDTNTNFKLSHAGITLSGCPLEQKISEMNLLKSQGQIIGTLATIMIDNPMCAGTGHRICNDCMKSCIYQKQDPVDIPKLETRILKDVLSLPFGFEIYSLLSRWNPLNIRKPLPSPPTNKKILIVGLGPSGYTLAHYLLNAGYSVIAIDGIKIEPLPEYLSGVAIDGKRADFNIIKDTKKELFESLEDRKIGGFGGVSEYGITARWDKNSLKIVRLLLERRRNFAMFGGVRFGGTLNVAQSFDLGFDHIALATGSASPKIINIPGMLSKGVRMASDFLMSLQLMGAAKNDSLTNLQIRMPILVIGGGLTAIDTATEVAAYYPTQVEKFARRYNMLVQKYGKKKTESEWDDEEREIAAEFLRHAEEIRKERSGARHNKPDLLKLMNKWGGVKIVYRKKMQDSPAYKLNHEELHNALVEGIEFIEEAIPLAVLVDQYQNTDKLQIKINERELLLSAKTILVAAGTKSNTVIAKEDNHINLNGDHLNTIKLTKQHNQRQQDTESIITTKLSDGRSVSFFGDLNPRYHGSVVKAMASAKQGYKIIDKLLKARNTHCALNSQDFIDKMHHLLCAKISNIIIRSTKIVEIIIEAPLAAKNFQPGQFYRLQNFEYLAPKFKSDSNLTSVMEGLALTGYWVNKKEGLISTIALEIGTSSSICRYLNIGDPVIFMGPTGNPSFIPKNKNIMLIGGGVGNASLPSISKAMMQNGCQIIYFSGYKKIEDRFGAQLIENSAQQVIWSCEETTLATNRVQDLTFHGDIINAIMQYQNIELWKKNLVDLKEIDMIFVIGSAQMMEAVTHACNTTLKSHLKSNYKIVASINSPMQCMMKEICAQCLQQHYNPLTGKTEFVYSCVNQDQDANKVNFLYLKNRLKQNSLQEKISMNLFHKLNIAK